MYDTTDYEHIFQKERIQSNMEERALQLILKNIVCDPYFTWEKPTVSPSIDHLYLEPM
jgi:hypothetical protein